MADQASIFGNQNSPVTPDPTGGSNTPNASLDPSLANLLTEIKNERGEPKYKTLQDALVALKHSQEYIPQLTQKLNEQTMELTTLKGEVGKMTELEKAVQALTQQVSNPSTNGPAITEEQIANLVTKTLTKTQQEAVAKKNLEDVASLVSQKFGTEAEKLFYDKGKELGLSPEEFNALAAKTPKAVLRLLGVEGTSTQNTGAPTTSTINASGFTPQPNSLVGKNTKSAIVGATTQELRQESENAKKMVEELHAQGLTVHDLTDPKIYFKRFG